MKKGIKFLTIFSLILALTLATSVVGFAKTKGEIYSESVSVAAGEAVSIPIYIKNNPGLMGYKIVIEYDEDIFTPTAVTRGDVLKSGIFNDSIGTAEQGTVSVLWCDTAEYNDNGLLFTVEFATSAEAKGEYSLKISSSDDDTFNVNWKTVKLDSTDVKLDFGGAKEELSFWQKIVLFFENAWNFLQKLFSGIVSAK